jgi:DNA-binding response OmpR family regulator
MTTDASAAIVLLLVEDDENLRDLLEMALADQGFEVALASSGTDAVAELNAAGARLKAVVTDIQLGIGPSGWEVGRRARELVSGIPVVYMSGNSVHEWSANGVPESVMLQKPFVMAQLITAITTLLNSASSATALRNAMAHDGHAKPLP